MLKRKVVPHLLKITNTVFGSKCLFYTNVGLSCALSGLGDVLEQKWENYKDGVPLNPERTKRMAISGIFVGIVCHHYYRILDTKFPGRAAKRLVQKIVIDQTICSPLCILTLFITLGFLEGVSKKDFIENVNSKAMRLYTAEWVVWPPAQFVNFYFLPNKYRVLYDNTISLGYDIYTSYVTHDDER